MTLKKLTTTLLDYPIETQRAIAVRLGGKELGVRTRDREAAIISAKFEIATSSLYPEELQKLAQLSYDLVGDVVSPETYNTLEQARSKLVEDIALTNKVAYGTWIIRTEENTPNVSTAAISDLLPETENLSSTINNMFKAKRPLIKREHTNNEKEKLFNLTTAGVTMINNLSNIEL